MPGAPTTTAPEITFAPGARVLIRDAEWVIRSVDSSAAGGLRQPDEYAGRHGDRRPEALHAGGFPQEGPGHPPFQEGPQEPSLGRLPRPGNRPAPVLGFPRRGGCLRGAAAGPGGGRSAPLGPRARYRNPSGAGPDPPRPLPRHSRNGPLFEPGSLSRHHSDAPRPPGARTGDGGSPSSANTRPTLGTTPPAASSSRPPKASPASASPATPTPRTPSTPSKHPTPLEPASPSAGRTSATFPTPPSPAPSSTTPSRAAPTPAPSPTKPRSSAATANTATAPPGQPSLPAFFDTHQRCPTSCNTPE